MNQTQKVSLFALRITIGWLFFWAGITKIMNPEFSAAGYLKDPKMFVGFYHWLASDTMIPIVNFLAQWGLTLIGLALIFGVAVKLSGKLGAIMMILFYLPILDFPYPNAHSYIVDEHIIYAAALLVLSAWRAGRVWGLEEKCENLPICKQFPKLRHWLG